MDDFTFDECFQGKNQKKKKMAAAGGDKGVSELNPPPSYIADRIAMWDRLKAKRVRWEEEKAAENKAIKITLPDGKSVDGVAWKTTPYDVACGISKGLADSCVVAKINSEVWDLDRVLEGDCSLQLLKFDDEEGQAVFWHSSAHVLGEAMERVYGGHLCYGPPIENGYYYDMFSEECRVSSTLAINNTRFP